jgi:hypothetical protein
MEKSKVIACLWLSLVVTATAQSLTLSSLAVKGAIQTLSVEPVEPTTASPVTLRATVAEPLDLDRVETQRIGSTFLVKIYWSEPPAGSLASEPGLCREPLGTLAKGSYHVIVQSFCGSRLAGSKQLSFKVTEAPSPAMGTVIDEVWVTPEDPTTSDNTVVHVSGSWPTAGYAQPVSMTRLSGQIANIDLYWEKPQGSVALVVTPFTYNVPLKLALAGTYTIRTRVYLDGQLVDWEEISVEVIRSGGSDWTWNTIPWGIDLS